MKDYKNSINNFNILNIQEEYIKDDQIKLKR
jgi:hypothetical protein